jgi:hypothetical protein
VRPARSRASRISSPPRTRQVYNALREREPLLRCDPYLLSSCLRVPRRSSDGVDVDRPRGRRAARSARELGVRPRRSGDLPSYKIGGTRRFDPDEFRDWIERQRENGRAPERPARRERKARKPSPAKSRQRPDERQPRLFE